RLLSPASRRRPRSVPSPRESARLEVSPRPPKGAIPVKSAVLVLCGLLAGTAAARAQFEGVADFRITTNTGKGEAVPGTGKISVTRAAYRMELLTDVSKISRGKSGRAADAPQRITI